MVLFQHPRLIYKRACQEYFSPCAGCAGWVRDIQPLSHRDARVVSCPGLFHLSSCIFVGSDDADRVLGTGKRGGCMLATMDLSEARGLVLFRVVREGIGISQRLDAIGTVSSTGVRDAHPRTRASQEPTGHHQRKAPEMGGFFSETLKRLVISVSRCRSFLPSSTASA